MANVMVSGDENNVLFTLLAKSSTIRKLLLVFFLLSIFLEFRAAEECDFVKCVTGVRSYIFDLTVNSRTRFTCKKISEIPWCSENCMHKYFPNIFSNSKGSHLSFTRYCEENISNRINANWSCIARHTYRLLTCFVNVNSLTANNVREDMLTESCRKHLEFPNCPKEVLLADCGKESSDAIKDVILFILSNYQPVSCEGANVKEVLSMPVSYQFGSEFIDAAKSLDDHRFSVQTCLNQLIQDEIDLDGYMCGEYDPDLSDCVNYALKKTGKPHPDVKRFLLKVIALSGFKCKQPSLEPQTIGTLHSSESDKIKSDDYLSLKDGTLFNSLEVSTSKNIEDDYNFKSTTEFSTYAKTETEEKSEIPMKESSVTKKSIKIFNVSDSVIKNFKRQMNQNVYTLNVSQRINLSIHLIFISFVFLLFIFR